MNSKVTWLIKWLSITLLAMGLAIALLVAWISWLSDGPPDEGLRDRCLNTICEGDRIPEVDRTRFFQMKVNGVFLAAPNELFMGGRDGAVFPIPGVIQEPNAREANAELFLEPNQNLPYFYREDFLTKAERNGWIASRTVVRPGLERWVMKHLAYEGYLIDRVQYYVPMQRLPSGLPPPWAICIDGGGGAMYPWKYGIRVYIRWLKGHCDRWPEIYEEATRRMNLVEKIE